MKYINKILTILSMILIVIFAFISRNSNEAITLSTLHIIIFVLMGILGFIEGFRDNSFVNMSQEMLKYPNKNSVYPIAKSCTIYHLTNAFNKVSFGIFLNLSILYCLSWVFSGFKNIIHLGLLLLFVGIIILVKGICLYFLLGITEKQQSLFKNDKYFLAFCLGSSDVLTKYQATFYCEKNPEFSLQQIESISNEIESDGVDGLVTNTKENIYVENENIYADNNQPTKKQKGLGLMDAVENHINNEDVNIYADDSDDNIYYSSEDDLNQNYYADGNDEEEEEFEI